MNTLIISIIAGVAVTFAASIFAIIGFSIRRAIFDKIDVFTEEIKKLEDKIIKFKEEMLRYYITKEDYKSNESSHKEMWKEISSLKERLTKLEN